MKNLFKKSSAKLKDLQNSVHFEDEPIDFTRRKIWLNQVEKHATNRLASVAIYLAAALTIIVLLALIIILLQLNIITR